MKFIPEPRLHLPTTANTGQDFGGSHSVADRPTEALRLFVVIPPVSIGFSINCLLGLYIKMHILPRTHRPIVLDQ